MDVRTIYVKRYPKCDGRCQMAINKECMCQCQGRYHGFVYKQKRTNLKIAS